jgi:hypothetical protein
MRKPFRLRTLMIAVLTAAFLLAPVRLYRRYRADKVRFDLLVAEHLSARLSREVAIIARDEYERSMIEANRDATREIREAEEILQLFQNVRNRPVRRYAAIRPQAHIEEFFEDQSYRREVESLERAKSRKEGLEATSKELVDEVDQDSRREATAQAAIDGRRPTGGSDRGVKAIVPGAVARRRPGMGRFPGRGRAAVGNF